MSAKTLDELFASDREYWTDGQIAAFMCAHAITRKPVGVRAAAHWKRQRGNSFAAWRALSKSERKMRTESYGTDRQ